MMEWFKNEWLWFLVSMAVSLVIGIPFLVIRAWWRGRRTPKQRS